MDIGQPSNARGRLGKKQGLDKRHLTTYSTYRQRTAPSRASRSSLKTMSNSNLPTRAAHLPIADIHGQRDARRKVKTAGTYVPRRISSLDQKTGWNSLLLLLRILSYPVSSTHLCVLADCSSCAIFRKGQEVPSSILGQAEPSLFLDLRLVLQDPEQLAPAKGDKVLVTGNLVPQTHPEIPSSVMTPVPTNGMSSTKFTKEVGGALPPEDQGTLPIPGLQSRAHLVLEVESIVIDDELDVAAFDRTARKMSHHVALHAARNRLAEAPDLPRK